MFALFGISGRDVKDLNDPTKKQVNKVRGDIRRGIRRRPEQKHLVIYALACHGMQVDGRQNAVINEHSRKNGWYEMINFEHDVRD